MRLSILIFICVGVLSWSCQKKEYDSSFAPLPSAQSLDANKQLEFINERIDDNALTAEYYFHRSKLNSESNRFRAAMRDIQAAIRLDSSKSQYHFWKANLLNMLNTPREAIGSALIAERMGYSGLELDMLLGKLHYLNQNPVQSLVHLRRARQVNPQDSDISYLFGAIYADAKDTAQAFNELHDAIKLDSSNSEAYVKAIQLATDFQLLPKAKSLVKNAVSKCEMNEDLSYELARFLLTNNQVDSASYWFSKMLALNPESWKANFGMAKYLIAKKQYVEAEDYYVNALEYNPNIQGGYYQLGYIYEYYAKDVDKAIKYYKKAKRLNRSNEEIASALKRAERKKENKNRVYTPRAVVQDSTASNN